MLTVLCLFCLVIVPKYSNGVPHSSLVKTAYLLQTQAHDEMQGCSVAKLCPTLLQPHGP